MTLASPQYEQTDVDAGRLAWAGLAVVTFLALAPLLLWPFAPTREPPSRPHVTTAGAPVLQLDEPADLALVRQQTDPRLSSFGWVDRERQVLHIPIDRAMSIIAARGLPEPQK